MSLQASPKLGVVEGAVLRSVQAHLWPWCSQRHAVTYPATPAVHRLGGKHQGQGQVCAGHLERQRAPGAAQLQGGNQLSIRTSPHVSSWSAGRQSQACPCPYPELFSPTTGKSLA